jgi:hypothetical protein
MDTVVEGACCQRGKLPSVAVGKGNHHAGRGEIAESGKRIGGKAGFGLFAVRNDG